MSIRKLIEQQSGLVLRYRLTAIAAAALLLSSCAHNSPPPTPVTVSLQGGALPTCADRLVSGFYDITVAEFAHGADNVNLASYEERSFAHFRATASAMRMSPEALVDHAKGIPKQMIQIVKDDPKVLDSCQNFSLALTGPP